MSRELGTGAFLSKDSGRLLTWAAKEGHVKLVETILNTAAMNMSGQYSSDVERHLYPGPVYSDVALHCAVRNGFSEVCNSYLLCAYCLFSFFLVTIRL